MIYDVYCGRIANNYLSLLPHTVFVRPTIQVCFLILCVEATGLATMLYQCFEVS